LTRTLDLLDLAISNNEVEVVSDAAETEPVVASSQALHICLIRVVVADLAHWALRTSLRLDWKIDKFRSDDPRSELGHMLTLSFSADAAQLSLFRLAELVCPAFIVFDKEPYGLLNVVK
jgi:hypothetical protein